jgi:diguanylate cyclase (GGDEF)-like protein
VEQLGFFDDRSPITVLVVDDDEHASAVIRRRLQEHARRYRVLQRSPAELMGGGLPPTEVDVVLVGVRSEHTSLTPLRWLSRHAEVAVVALHHGEGLDDSLDHVVTGAQDVLPFSEATTVRLDRVIRSAIARKRAEIAAMAHALSDPVTGMASRPWMIERLEIAVTHAATCADGWQVAVLFCDLDRFKAVNDSLGHAKGDELLRLVAERLRSVVRADDPVTRFGGDEFVILLEGYRVEALAMRIAERAIKVLCEPFMLDGHAVTVRGSIGLAILAPGETAGQLLENADHALYEAKRLGRNRIEVFDDELRAWSDEQQRLARRLRHDLEAGRLSIHERPLWDLTTGRRLGAVAVASWPEVESPADLVDVALRNGLGPALGRWLTRQAILDGAQGDDPASQIVVEVPPGLVGHPAFVGWIEDALDVAGIDPTRLVIAITESELVDADAVRPVLEALDRLDVSVALAGFGSDSASLALFGSMLVDEVFLAPQLIEGLSVDPPRRAVVESLLRIAGAIGQRVVATGPQCVEDVTTLIELGCVAVVSELDLSGVVSEPGVRLPDIARENPLVLR